MITVDQQVLDATRQRWEAAIVGKIQLTGLAMQDTVRKEAGRLVQTLIRTTPPGDRSESWRKLESHVNKTFTVLGQDSGSSKEGRGGVRWYAFQPNAIFGIAKDKDMTRASVEDLYQLYLNTTIKNGKTVSGRRGKQTVYIRQKIATSAATVKKLIARLKDHYGRLKAGYLPAWKELGRPVSDYGPPAWVTKHESGARGYAINGLNNSQFPEFTIENHAKGAGSPMAKAEAAAAMDIRAKAMIKRTAILLQHPEKMKEEVF